MFEKLFTIIRKLLGIETNTTDEEIKNNDSYAENYKNTDSINFTAIFSNKIANYTICDSELTIPEDNERAKLLAELSKSVWKKMKKITSMALGVGGVALVPYVKNGSLFYNFVPQNRVNIDSMDGEDITGATILAEIRTITSANKVTKYYRWTHYKIENENLTIEQKYTDEDGKEITVPTFWSDIQPLTITNVNKVPFGFIKSPINNRDSNDKYGVPITFGCDSTIEEIRTCMQQIAREYELKEVFVGADSTLFKDGKLPNSRLIKALDTTEDDMFQVFDPAIRDSSLYARLQELYIRLEKEINTSRGIITETETSNATATEIKRAMYDTFVIVDDMRANIEKGLNDFFYACDILANAYSLSAQGEYELNYNWDYGLLEDSTEAFTQLVQGKSMGVVSDEEVRMFIYPTETPEQAQEKIEEIKANNPSVKDLIGVDA